jgi:hypothetical protein
MPDPELDTDLTEETDEEVEAESTPESLVQFDGNQMLMDLMSDPLVQKVLTAKKEGRAITLTEEDTAGLEPEAAAEAAELAELDEFADEDIKKLVVLLDKKLKHTVEPISQRLTQLEGLAQGYEKQAVDGQIAAVANKHSDFDKYRKAMAELARGPGAGLGVEELYAVAKLRAGELPLTEPSTHSERPTPTPRRPGAKDKKAAPARGRKAFQIRLADALEDLDIPR